MSPYEGEQRTSNLWMGGTEGTLTGRDAGSLSAVEVADANSVSTFLHFSCWWIQQPQASLFQLQGSCSELWIGWWCRAWRTHELFKTKPNSVDKTQNPTHKEKQSSAHCADSIRLLYRDGTFDGASFYLNAFDNDLTSSQRTLNLFFMNITILTLVLISFDAINLSFSYAFGLPFCRWIIDFIMTFFSKLH